MNSKGIKGCFFCIFCFIFIPLGAQTKSPEIDEYKAEIGLDGGLGYYMGELNSQLFGKSQPAYGGYFRYKFNNRLAAKVGLESVTIPQTGTVYCGDICGEVNFFDLEKNPYRRYSKIYAPYLFAGISLLTDIYNGQQGPVAGIPFGIGMKLRLSQRWNLNAQWTNRLMFTDNMEGGKTGTATNNPGEINGSNIFNNDLVSTLTIGVSFSIWKKPCNCRHIDNMPEKHYFK